MTSARADMPHYVYRCFNSDGALLYVGSTYSPPQRMGYHAARAEWWPQVASVRNTVYPNYQAALDRERRAIFEEHPVYNVKGADSRELRLVPRGARKRPLNHSPEAVRAVIKRSPMTQREIAKRVGVSAGQMSEICNGNRSCNQAVLIDLAKLLDCPLAMLESRESVSA